VADVTREQILKDRPNRSDAALRKASEHLWYELEMLRFCGSKLIEDLPRNGWLYATVMESFLIHARNLNEFFFATDIAIERGRKRPPYKDDMIVEDFLGGLTWTKPDEYRLSEKEVDLISKRLAHLTYSRRSGERYPPGFYRRIMTSLFGLAEAFLTVAPEANLDSRLLERRPRRA